MSPTDFLQTKYEYDEDGNCVYKGQHRDPNALESDEFWIIFRYGYDENGNCNEKLMRTGSWTDRATKW